MKAIAAMSNNRIIGNHGRIPWKCWEDLQFFKRMTMGDNLIMGRTTFKDAAVLPGRFTYVLTKDTKRIGASNSDFFEYIGMDGVPFVKDPTWVCGGASVYKQLLPQCSDLYLTIILDDYEGDTYMPDFEHLFSEQRIIRETKSYWIVHYWKKGTLLEECYREGMDFALMGNDILWACRLNCNLGSEEAASWFDGYTKYHKDIQ